MKITWLGHSCFLLEEQGYRIVLDPYADDYVPGYGPVREEAEEVLCSHEHRDHNARECVTLVKNEKQNPFRIEFIECFHDHHMGAHRGENRITIFSDGRKRVAHFGDLGCLLSPEQIEKLQGIDLALIPVGGYYTISSAEAGEILKKIRCRSVIPMHYRSTEPDFGYEVLSEGKDFVESIKTEYPCQTLEKGTSTLDTDSLSGARALYFLSPKNL